MKKGFTLLELIVVVIIVGVLGSLGFAQYTKVVEKSRTAEAKAVLGQMRGAEEAYRVQYGGYTGTIANLSVEAATTCGTTNYFTYGVSATQSTATRCTTGRTPVGAAAYTLTLDHDDGEWGGSSGYY